MSDPVPITQDPTIYSSQQDAEIRSLAESIHSQTSNGSDNLTNPYIDTSDPELDPWSGQFNSRKWTATILGLKRRYGSSKEITAGVAFKNLGAYGYGGGADYQKTVANAILGLEGVFRTVFRCEKKEERVQILSDFNGVLWPGETCVVLGRPGSGCTTLLKSIACETYGFKLDKDTQWNYQGIPRKVMQKTCRGEIVYNAEVDVHFPHLTVGDTLMFASLARTPQNRFEGVSREQYAKHTRDVTMASLGLSHTLDTKVGNDFVRGVSGGERKRVSIAESIVCGSPLQCWDNSTRGLDAATATEFLRWLRHSAELTGASMFVSLYQASQEAYDLFDKVTVLYEGQQIYFGPSERAKAYFEEMGFECPHRQTTGDFLTSITSPAERIVKPGFEGKTPRTACEFAERWRQSQPFTALQEEIERFNHEFPVGGNRVADVMELKHEKQSDHIKVSSPYTISVPMQVKLCLTRGFQRLRGDLSMALTTVLGNFVVALILSSMFYNMPEDTSSFFSRGALLFFAMLMNAMSSVLEIIVLYELRPIVEKHQRYAMYHPFCEALASIICDFPTKFLTMLCVNVTLYFMSNLRREAGPFFIFFLFTLMCVLAMSMIFRTIAAVTKTLQQALAPAAVIILGLIIYTGFTLPISYMRGWARWINYIDPIAYGFEAVMVNEFRNRDFPCAVFVPQQSTYDVLGSPYQGCMAVGAEVGQRYVRGDRYLEVAFDYSQAHLWRNLGILFGFVLFFAGTYLTAVEFIQSAKSKGEVLVFLRSSLKQRKKRAHLEDVEASAEKAGAAQDREILAQQEDESSSYTPSDSPKDIFQWKDVCYDIKVKGGEKRLLDHVDGWVKPGTLTALMGCSGAGKTTLLDVLADRKATGVITGDMRVNGQKRDASFQRKTGYVQQQDLHTATSTVREALEFSALLRQPSSVPKADKIAYVDEVIDILEMQAYADAVVGVPGEGLNVEQRKRLTIGVELAAKPELLLFLDEPTSGLDSQTAWSIICLLKKLANRGQAILCTIHQPSAILFQEFDRLLFMTLGGKTVYYGDIGPNSASLITYFESKGADPCPAEANPAEWMLAAIGAAPGSVAKHDWALVWNESEERAQERDLLDKMAQELAAQSALDEKNELVSSRSVGSTQTTSSSYSAKSQYATSQATQLYYLTKRLWTYYWRSPRYIWSKLLMSIASALFIGFSYYKASQDIQGLQNQMFAFFMLFLIFVIIMVQILPHFVAQRELYEARERSSMAYSWQAFMGSNILVEIPWQTLVAVLVFFCFYYPIGLQNNATGHLGERGALFFLLLWSFYVYNSTFAHMMGAAFENKENAATIGYLLFALCLIFCGVLATKEDMPHFWIFMYRVSPLTYLVSGLLSAGVGQTDVVCTDNELVKFKPMDGTSCGQYMTKFIAGLGELGLPTGYLVDPQATDMCGYCPIHTTDGYLDQVDVKYSQRWRNYGILFAYPAFNVFMAFAFYYIFRVPKKSRKQKV
ncbi:Multidrug resistance protein [Yarrowia sp. B02]|nr:Multidrug resistance protein [Yarrowia sp. B02]